MAVFRGAAAAVACAVGDAAARSSAATATPPSRSTSGSASRSATSRARAATASGMPVVEAVRLCGHADGGQILATDLVRVVGGRDGHRLPGAGRPRAARPAPSRCRPARSAGSRPGGRAVACRSRPGCARARRRPTSAAPRRASGSGRAGRRPGAGPRQAVLVSGEPGIGKTRFTVHAACDLHAEGAIVLAGHAAEGLAVPYGPWIEALGPLVEHAPEATLAAHVERHGGELSRLVPALARRVPRAPAPGADGPRDRALPALHGGRRAARARRRGGTRRPRARRPALGRRADARPPAPRRHRGAGRAAAGAGHLPRHGPRPRPPARRRCWPTCAASPGSSGWPCAAWTPTPWRRSWPRRPGTR